MESLEQINPSQIRNFFVSLCAASSRYEKRQKAMLDLDKHMEKLQKHPKFKNLLNSNDISQLKSKINEVLGSERKILGNKKLMNAKENELIGKINSLERELEQARLERDSALEENKQKIHELNIGLLSVKTRMEKLIEHKREREKRIRELEKKINKKAR